MVTAGGLGNLWAQSSFKLQRFLCSKGYAMALETFGVGGGWWAVQYNWCPAPDLLGARYDLLVGRDPFRGCVGLWGSLVGQSGMSVPPLTNCSALPPSGGHPPASADRLHMQSLSGPEAQRVLATTK